MRVHANPLKGLSVLLVGMGVTGCFTAPYLSRAEATLVEPPSIIAPVAHPARAAATAGLRLTASGTTDFESTVRSARWFEPRSGPYVANWAPVAIGGDARLIARVADPFDGFSVLADYHVGVNVDPENPVGRHAVLAGIGLTFPNAWGSLRLSPAIGRHAHHVAATETWTEGDCLDECTYHTRDFSRDQSALLLAWGTTLWWPPELTGFPLAPHVGYQFTRSFIPAVTGIWSESLTLRRHSLEAGVRHVGRFATLGVTGTHEVVRHRSEQTSYPKVRIEAERGFGRRSD